MLSRRGFLNRTLGAGAGFALAAQNPQPAAAQGARQPVIVDAQGPRLIDGTADWLWPAAEKAGFPVMFLGGPMSHYAGIAEKHPQLQLIIDHMGLSLDIAKAGKRGEAIDQSTSLAKYPNVSIKLTSAPTYSFEPYPYRDMLPFIKRCFDAFG